MSLLLDTHAFLWWMVDDARLSAKARKRIADPRRTVYLSAASAWEISTKHRLGKLSVGAALLADLPGLLANAGFLECPITIVHAARAGSLGGNHRDPFDRMIAAQSMCEGLEVVTIDPALEALGARCVW